MTSSIDGLVSGLNTTQIISQLMQVAAAPQTALENQQAKEQSRVSAYQGVNSKLAALQTAAEALTGSAVWGSVKATSSDASVTATASDGASAGTLSFDVVQTATYEQRVSAATYAGLSATVASSGTLTFTKADGSTVAVNATDGSLSSVVSAINAKSGLGVRAAAVAIGNGTYALQLSSTSTGAAAAFNVTGLDADDPNGGPKETVKAQDAQLSLPGISTPVTSSTNTFTNVVPGLTFTVSAKATGVRIDLASDSTAASNAAKAMVDAANAALDTISQYTAYNATTKTGGPLTGDYTMKSLQQSILNTVSDAIGGKTSASGAGISLTQDGHLAFDSAKFASAFNADPAALRNLVGPSAGFTPAGTYAGTVSLLSSSSKTQEVAGGHSLVVTRAGTRSTADLTLGTIDATSSLTLAGVTVTGQTGETGADFATRVNSALAAKGYSAVLSGSTLTISSAAYGAGSAFTPAVAGSGLTLASTTAGTDVAGTIDGRAATGSGQVLAGAAGTSAAGLSLSVTLTAADVAAGASGKVAFTAGVAQRLAALAASVTDPTNGSLTSLITSGQAQIKGLGDDISAWDVRLATQQTALQKQYADLEVALGKLKDQSSWLAGQLAGLSASHG